MFRFWIVLAILGIATIGASFTAIPSYSGAILGIVLGGVLVQASIIVLATSFGREKRPSSRKRRYEMRPAG